MPDKKTVFISCGQCTEEERALGKQAEKLVGELTPFEGYFAQNENSLQGVSNNILKRLYNSVGLVVIVHHRGDVDALGEKFIRASVWIEQEIAMATLMGQVLNRPLHVAAFFESGIKLEGIRSYALLHPSEFTSAEDVVAGLRQILPEWKTPLYTGDAELQKQVDSVRLSITIVGALTVGLTIEIRNHSALAVKIKSVELRGRDTRLCEPIFPPPSVDWLIRPNGPLTVNLQTVENIGKRLINVYGKEPTDLPRHSVFAVENHFRPILQIELLCEILGIEKWINENRDVRVNLTTGESNNL